MSLWPFMPLSGATEVLEWKTDVLRARAGEQRQRLREKPRRQWNFSHWLDDDGQSAARAILRGASSFEVPDWPRLLYAGPVSAGASVSVSLTTAGLGLAAGQSVVLWSGVDDYEVCSLESVSPSAIVLENVANVHASCGIYRVDVAHAAVELSIDRPAGPLQRASITFEAAAVEQYAASTYSQYRGHDVLPLVPVVGGGALDESLAWPRDVFDNLTGVIGTERQRDLPDEKFTLRWHALTAAAITEMRAWIASRYGRWLAFWVPTWQKDLFAAAAIGSSATTLRVFAPHGTTSLGRSTCDLELGVPSALLRRRVTAIAAGPTVSGRPTLDLTLDSALGVAVTVAEFGRISFLRCVRFDADRVEFLHRAGEGVAVSVPCIEVPVS